MDFGDCHGPCTAYEEGSRPEFDAPVTENRGTPDTARRELELASAHLLFIMVQIGYDARCFGPSTTTLKVLIYIVIV